MKIIGFNLTKVLAQKAQTKEKVSINTNIEFTNIEEESLDMFKEDTLKVSFSYSIDYDIAEKKKSSKEDLSNITFDGYLIITLEKNLAKEVVKSWKKKTLSDDIKIPMFNFILRKCTPKAVALEDELNLPFHIPLPRVSKKQ